MADLLRPPYSQAELIRLDLLRSRLSVARTVLAERLERGLTQEELGRAAGTKQSRVSEIEALKGNPRFDTLDRIARVLGLMIALVPARSQVGVRGAVSEFRTHGEVRISGLAHGSEVVGRYRDLALQG